MKVYKSNDPKQSLEQKLIASSCLLLSAAMLLSTVFNYFMDLGRWIIYTTIAATILFALIYVLARFTRYQSLAKWLTTFFALLFINFAWYTNNASNGPSFFLLVIFLAYLVYFWEKPLLYVFVGIVAINFLLLLALEYFNLANVPDYQDKTSKILDTYLGLFIALLIMIFFSSTVKRSYIQQYKRAQKSDELKSLFIRNMSHEIRTPLNAIVGFSELLSEQELQPNEKRDYADIVAYNSRTLTGLINNIIDVSNLESNLIMVRSGSFNMVHLVERQIQDARNKLLVAGKNDVEIIFHSNTFELYLNSDEGRLEQALANLLDNAVKFTVRGEISVWFKIDEDKVWIYVRDTGIGIKHEHLQIIFDRFVRLEDNLTTHYRGTGIGLYLSKEIVHLLGGELYVESEPGMGSTFFFYVPYGKSL